MTQRFATSAVVAVCTYKHINTHTYTHTRTPINTHLVTLTGMVKKIKNATLILVHDVWIIRWEENKFQHLLELEYTN